MRISIMCLNSGNKFNLTEMDIGEELDYDVVNIVVTCSICKRKKIIYSVARD